MGCTFTPSICHINLGTLVRNFRRLGPAQNLMPVIKADAYGHGLLPVAKALDKAGALYFAVGTPAEGKELRETGLQQQIVPLMGCLDKEDWHLALSQDLTPIAGSFEDIDLATQVSSELGCAPIKIAIKCDTGMSRLGFNMAELRELREKLSRSGQLSPQMLISHLACADMPQESDYTQAQIKIYGEFHAALASSYPRIKKSLGNSAASIGLCNHMDDIARPGLALYGGNPFFGTSLEHLGTGLAWVMSVSTPIIHIRELKTGQSVSYGRIFTASRPMRVAVLACGYASGVYRNLSGRLEVLVNGRRAMQIGRICMGMMMVDISAIEGVKKGDRAWLLGGQPEGCKAPDAQELANLMDTIPYEVLCHMGALNPRCYED